jgi:hypothetical protein
MKNRRLIPIIVPLAILLLSEIFLFYPHLFFIALAFGVLIIMFSVRDIGRDNREKFWPLFFVLPTIIFLSLSSYASLISNGLLIQVIFLISSFLIFFYLRGFYYYLIFKEKERADELNIYSPLFGFLAIFAIFTTIFTLPLFINLTPLVMILAVVPVVWFLFFQSIIFNKTSFKESIFPFLINTLILFELSWLFSFFPLRSDILGFLSAITYYLLLTVSRLSFRGDLNRQNLKWPIFLSSLAVLILLLTARWL